MDNINDSSILITEIEKMIAVLDYVEGTLNQHDESAIKKERQIVEDLLVDWKHISDLIKKKEATQSLLLINLTKKFYPDLLNKLDEFYSAKHLTEFPELEPKSLTRKIKSEKVGEQLKDNFELLIREHGYDKLYEFLVNNNFIDPNTNKESFLALLKLQPILPEQRIIWIDETRGKVGNQTLVRLITNIFKELTPKLHGRKSYSFLIIQYFTAKSGELKPGSLEAAISIIKPENKAGRAKNSKETEIMFCCSRLK